MSRATCGKALGMLLLALLALPMRLLQTLWRRLSSRHKIRRRRDRALALAVAEIVALRTRLQVRRLQLVVPDHYGSPDIASWTREKRYFCDSRIRRRLAAGGLVDQWPTIAHEVERRIEKASMLPSSAPRGFDPRMDPLEYERLCALLLRKAGWDAQVTPASGDQGTDVLARRGKRSLVLQCKLYSKPVGNSAVQQIAAARAHHRADFAAVVSNADFTLRARQLAATNGVYLLHHEELREFPPRKRSLQPGLSGVKPEKEVAAIRKAAAARKSRV